MGRKKPRLGLQATITVFACIVVALALLAADIVITKNISSDTERNIALGTMEVARSIANSPVVIDGLSGRQNEGQIQIFVDKVTNIMSDIQFIVVMDMNKIRKSHPNPAQIGTYYEDEDGNAAFDGQETTSVRTGSLGVSLRAFTPVFNANGQQIGVVLSGTLLEKVQETVDHSRRGIYAGIGVGMLVGVLGSLILAGKIKKSLFGLEPFAIAQIFEERSAMLQSVKEGILAVDKESYITIVNEEAMKIFQKAGIVGNPLGKKVNDYVPHTNLQNILRTGQAELDHEQELNGIRILANRIPVIVKGEIVGAITSFRDETEIKQLAEKLTDVSNYAEALRAQTHEFMNKMHAIRGMMSTKDYDRLTNYVNEIADQYQVEVGSVVSKIKDPVLAGFLLGKISLSREAGGEMILSEGSFLPVSAEPEVVHELIIILGNLINNALEAVEESLIKRISLDISYESDILIIEVSDTGQGIKEEMKKNIFKKGYSNKGTDRGLGLYLIERSLERLGGEITVISKVGYGTTFKVVVPYWSQEEGYID
ncbi:DcuS/MalK family sensor histidine kinase [Pelosinus sp. sgz500959]|uniref:DcuS/MalK family sensor histidine kinase n=1 Tax=Pelosinus sp. sgz500959 TaxID=3242472 RepID=UPI00366D8DBF